MWSRKPTPAVVDGAAVEVEREPHPGLPVVRSIVAVRAIGSNLPAISDFLRVRVRADSPCTGSPSALAISSTEGASAFAAAGRA